MPRNQNEHATHDHDSLRDCLHGAQLIMCDCPWRYDRDANSNGWHGSARRHYKGMGIGDLLAMDVGRYCADDCILLMWATSRHLPEALAIMKSWQFQYKTVFQTWIKTTKKGTPCMGLGRYSRSSSEFLLLGIKGKVQKLLSPTANDVLGVIFAPRTKHSQKPDQAILRINTRFAPCRKRVELFCRGQAPSGWLGWGDEMEDSDVGV
jgi:N6-adenosine-specific RNA methylase IME4